MELNDRQKQVLNLIIEHHIQYAEPVASKALVDAYRLDVSPATIRNDMALLEKLGYIRSPHTSAGRVPTEKAYVYYLTYVKPAHEGRAATRLQKSVREMPDEETALKSVAKAIVDLSGETVVLALDPRWSFYTGVANLFAKPEFSDFVSTSALIDQFDEVIAGLYQSHEYGLQVFVGQENPFGSDLSAIVVRYQLPNREQALLGLLGPLRMNYARNIGLLESALAALSEMYEQE